MARYSIILKENKSIELTKANSTTLVYRVPYSLIKNKSHGLVILNQFVVYILSGIDEKGHSALYVGKSKNGIDNRPTSHENKNVIWKECYILTNFKERTFFNDGTIQYIEDKIKHRIDDTTRFENKTIVTNGETANAIDMEYCDEYIAEAYNMLYVLGLDLSLPDKTVVANSIPTLCNIPDSVKPLYNELCELIKEIDSGITSYLTKLYSNFVKDDKIIISVEPYSSSLKIYFNIAYGGLQDPENKAEDCSNIGHHANGDYRITITDNRDFDYIKKLVIQVVNHYAK